MGITEFVDQHLLVRQHSITTFSRHSLHLLFPVRPQGQVANFSRVSVVTEQSNAFGYHVESVDVVDGQVVDSGDFEPPLNRDNLRPGAVRRLQKASDSQFVCVPPSLLVRQPEGMTAGSDYNSGRIAFRSVDIERNPHQVLDTFADHCAHDLPTAGNATIGVIRHDLVIK